MISIRRVMIPATGTRPPQKFKNVPRMDISMSASCCLSQTFFEFFHGFCRKNFAVCMLSFISLPMRRKAPPVIFKVKF